MRLQFSSANPLVRVALFTTYLMAGLVIAGLILAAFGWTAFGIATWIGNH